MNHRPMSVSMGRSFSLRNWIAKLMHTFHQSSLGHRERRSSQTSRTLFHRQPMKELTSCKSMILGRIFAQHTLRRTKPAVSHPEPPRPPRQEDNGPVAQTLTRQDQRLILQLEQSVQEIKAAQQQSAQSTEHRIITLESNLNSFQVSTTQVMGDFRKSLQEAVSTQQSQLQDTLLQVKQLFVRGQKRTARSPAPSDSASPRGDDDL